MAGTVQCGSSAWRFSLSDNALPLRHCWPPASPVSRAPPPLRVLPWCLVCLFIVFFLCVPVAPLSAAPSRPACAPCSSPCYPCSAAPCPLIRPSSLPSTVSLPILPALFVRPLCLVNRVCHPCALPLPLLVVPTFFAGGSPTLVLFPRSLSLTSSGMPWCPWWGGGLFADWTVALPEDWHDAGIPRPQCSLLCPLEWTVARRSRCGPRRPVSPSGRWCTTSSPAVRVGLTLCSGSPPALLALQLVSVPPLVVLHQHSSTSPHSTTASCQASRSAPHCSLYPRHAPRPAARALRLHPSAPPYSAAPSAPAMGPVPSAWLVCVRHHHIPLYRQPCPCLSRRTCASPLPSTSPRVRHTLPLPSSSFADSPCPPPLQLSSLLVCPSLPHSPCPWPLALLGPAAAPPYASPPYHPSRCNSSRSIRSLGFFPFSLGQSRLSPEAPLPASPSGSPPPFQAPFPWASLPCRPGR